jgi:hypothetical protein
MRPFDPGCVVISRVTSAHSFVASGPSPDRLLAIDLTSCRSLSRPKPQPRQTSIGQSRAVGSQVRVLRRGFLWQLQL